MTALRGTDYRSDCIAGSNSRLRPCVSDDRHKNKPGDLHLSVFNFNQMNNTTHALSTCLTELKRGCNASASIFRH